MTVERLKACDNIVACPKNWACTGVFCTNGGIKLDPVDDEAPPENSRESTLRKEVSQLKRLLSEKTMEVDFFTSYFGSGALLPLTSTNSGPFARPCCSCGLQPP